MLRSTITNHRQHEGLQKLSVLAGHANSLLGPNKKYKFIQDDTSGESTLVCSCFRIFENLELTCVVGQLVHETIQAHQKVYHTGTGSLLFLAGAWSRAALESLERGISVGHIISALSEGMDICLDVCRKCSIPTQSLSVKKLKSCIVTCDGLGLQSSNKSIEEASQASSHLQGLAVVDQKTLNTTGQQKVKLSRHFCEKSANVSTTTQLCHPDLPDIAHIAQGLSHGHVNAMNLVVEASRLQSKNNQKNVSCSTFDVTKLVTCVLPGLPEEYACVVPGCIVLLSAEQTSVAHTFKDKHLKVAFINGDLSETYRHLGFKRTIGIQCVRDQVDLSSSSNEERWIKQVLTLLLHLELNLILVSGDVSEKVIQRCCRHHILVVEKVKSSVLRAFAHATGTVPVTYATQLSKQCIGAGVKVSIWRDFSSYERKPSTTVNISTGENSELVTVILTSCVDGKLQALEDQFWACAYRVHHMLKDEVLLPGAGVTEMQCIHNLQRQRETNEECAQQTKAGTAANPYRGVVLQLMADGLIDYICAVMVNTGSFSKTWARTVVSQKLQDYNESLGVPAAFSQLTLESELDDSATCKPMESSEVAAVNIYDNLSVKKEAWRKALDLVFLVLQTDAELITDVHPKSDGAQENLMLL